ncbi:MAG: hypothetical protein AB7F43_03875 [Bacteriovoracia bacterium]
MKKNKALSISAFGSSFGKTFGDRHEIVTIVILAALYALAFTNIGDTSFWADAQSYFDYALNLVRTGIFGLTAGVADMQREPGYPFFLSLLIRIFQTLGITVSARSFVFVQLFIHFCFSWAAASAKGLPEKVKTIFFLLLIFSPTLIGAHREVYSESLSVLLSLLFFTFLQKTLFEPKNIKTIFFGFLTGTSFALITLTKAYLAPLMYVFLPFSLLLFRYRKQLAKRLSFELPQFSRFSLTLMTCSVLALCGNKLWDARNQNQLGDNQFLPRKSIAIAGKIARVHQMKIPEDLPVALTASFGTNICDSIFSSARCSRFDYRGCDDIGPSTLRSYLKKYPTPLEAETKLQADMRKLYFEKPFHQILASGLEVIRMSFFEAVANYSSLPVFLQWFSRAWHFLGSLILLFFFIKGLNLVKKEKEKLIYFAPFSFVSYHVIAMSQITNVVRYIFPIMPFIYLFCALGISYYSHSRKRK